MATSAVRYLWDAPYQGHYVRAWKENGETVVQVWKGDKPEGEPKGDWAMPRGLPLSAAIEQAILQTQ